MAEFLQQRKAECCLLATHKEHHKEEVPTVRANTCKNTCHVKADSIMHFSILLKIWPVDSRFLILSLLLLFDEKQSRYKHSRVVLSNQHVWSTNFRHLQDALKHHQQQSPTSCNSPSVAVMKMKAEDKAIRAKSYLCIRVWWQKSFQRRKNFSFVVCLFFLNRHWKALKRKNE